MAAIARKQNKNENVSRFSSSVWTLFFSPWGCPWRRSFFFSFGSSKRILGKQVAGLAFIAHIMRRPIVSKIPGLTLYVVLETERNLYNKSASWQKEFISTNSTNSIKLWR